jgi:hypothetical protein
MPNNAPDPEKQLEQLPDDRATLPPAAIGRAMDGYLGVVRDARSPNTAKAYGQVLLEHKVDKVPSPFLLITLPPKIKDGTGSPIRAVGLFY